MKLKTILPLLAGILMLSNAAALSAQSKALVNTSESPYAKLSAVDLGDVNWTNGFWADRYKVCMTSMVPHMLGKYMDPEIGHAFTNFEIAAGLIEGSHVGPPFHDGDFYKMMEGFIMLYENSRDEELDKKIDELIETIGKSQREDGYIHTPVVIEQRKHPEAKQEFNERLDFETYNLGHLMTAACLHNRITGKTNFLDIAVRSTDFLYDFYKNAPEELAGNAICPSHYMGVVEMYRTTKDERYLELAKGLIDIRKLVENGTDHNQDRIPFREQTEAVGHAVRANYLYAGVADVFAETGDTSLMVPLNHIWDDLVERKLYITGGCGALYDGVSPNGTTYDQPSIQQVHQAYGSNYQLPNISAHNESCANIGNILWNWRMLQIAGDARYADIIEQTAYNALLAGVSLDGTGYFYTNPLRVDRRSPDKLRWSKHREEYIAYCNCCPPNTIRTIAQLQNYAYSVSDEGLWVHLYGANKLSTKLADGAEIELQQITDYPWNGDITLRILNSKGKEFPVHLRIPEWTEGTLVEINGEKQNGEMNAGSYVELSKKWKKGDEIKLSFPMETKLIKANPLVEELRNQVAVKRGPIVYCLESMDVPEGSYVTDFAVPADVDFEAVPYKIGDAKVMALEGELDRIENDDWDGKLYQPVSNIIIKEKIRLVPYYAWDNRGKGDMSVWLPLSYGR